MNTEIRTLIVDIETYPASGYIWGLWDQTVGLNQIIKPGQIASWAAKWAGKEGVEYSSVYMTSRKKMIKEMWKLLDEADEVVGFNSNAFDLKWFNAEFALFGLSPPSPYRKVDLFRVCKQNFKLLSYKLDYIAGYFDIGHKLEHQGFNMWKECMAGDKNAWGTFEEYNVQDVLLTERLYDKLRPWITTGVNRSAFDNDHSCPACGSTRLQKRGTAMTTSLTYTRYQCKSCGHWSRSKVALPAERQQQLVSAR